MRRRYVALNLLQRKIPNARVKRATVYQKVPLARLWFHESKSIVTVQRRFRLEYQNFQSPNKNSIKTWYHQFKATRNVLHRKGSGRPSQAKLSN
ncbi:hypothetical protein AVEN_27940-1 [Araneus ventricosus]|uniref:DUF4817 domain-containing protein n=1 Tax=Araneus ventricosus TaxID=182803 RepID=A0A4Y2IL35_ARAVE|nr:hypothetical protein AVEN_27940-1 [Araneus ventricosus]